MQRKWPLCTVDLQEKNPRKCLNFFWAYEKTKTNRKKRLRVTWRLSGSKHPTRSHMFDAVAKPNGHWEAPTHSFPQKNPTAFPFILTHLIQILIETTHFFIQVVIFRGTLCLWSYNYYFLLNTKMKESSTALFYI